MISLKALQKIIQITKSNKNLILLALVLFSLFLTGCIDRGSSFYKKNAKSSAERRTKATEEIIAKSSDLKELDAMCRSLPFFEKIEPSRKSIGREYNILFYYYQLEKDFDELKEVYKKQLPEDGWKFLKEENGLWEDQVEFKKDKYWIRISQGRFGEENYGTNCEDLTLAD